MADLEVGVHRRYAVLLRRHEAVRAAHHGGRLSKRNIDFDHHCHDRLCPCPRLPALAALSPRPGLTASSCLLALLAAPAPCSSLLVVRLYSISTRIHWRSERYRR